MLTLWAPGVALAQCEVHDEAEFRPSDAAAGDSFGWSASISGDVAIFGAYGDDCGEAVNCGTAYVYRFNGSTWVEEAKLTASDAAAGDSFGWSVSISGDVAVVGADGDDCGDVFDCGSAYIFRFNGSTWVEEAKLTATDAAEDDSFGWSVSVSGNVAVVGAFHDDCGDALDCGSAYVYRFDGGTWVEETKLTASDAAPSELFGSSVSINGDMAIVGAHRDDCAAGIGCGAAYVYRFVPGVPVEQAWAEEAKLTASDAAAGDSFGWSIFVDGDVAIVGALRGDSANEFDCGSAYVYRYNSSTWVQEAELTGSDASGGDNFGYSVSIDGETAIVGAVNAGCAGRVLCGAAYVFMKPFDGWTDSAETARLTASDAGEGDHFGTSVALNGGGAIVGAAFDNCGSEGGFYCGSAYVFALPDPLCDCNDNGISDDRDIGEGRSGDCNDNTIPDECDTATGTSQDCNDDSIPDECEISGGSSLDCNGNRIPDECDFANGLSRDCNRNRIPDECEFHEDVKLTASDPAQGDQFGESISISGDTAVVGHPNDECAGGFLCGTAYVYRLNGNTWTREAVLAASDAESLNLFGSSVSVSGSVVAVGAWLDDCATGIACGSAYMYRFNGSAWTEEAKLTASDATEADLFGYSVSVSGDFAVVGSPWDECNGGAACGSAYVYQFDGSTWIEAAKLTASDATEGDLFGWSVSISGNVALVGAWGHYCGAGASCGAVYVYRFNGSSWIEEAKLTASDASGGDNFGYSVSIAGDVAVVGAREDDCAAGILCGSAYVYRFNPGAPGLWVEEAKITPSDADGGDTFGYSVDISGDTVVVGAVNDECAAGGYCGSAYVYRFNGNSWIELSKLTASDAAEGDLFGVSVSVDGNVAIVGAFHDDCMGGDLCGSVYVFALPPDCNTNGYTDECDVIGGTSFDCNANGILDECEPDQDCDGNGVQDICDIAACAGEPVCDDCDVNGVPDGCDIVFGATQDCNSNGVPDECDIRAGVSLDTDGDGVPDECQLGACCDHDPFGGCTDGLIREACSCERCEWFEDTLCDEAECSLDSVPTASSWGIAILSLLLLTGAKIRFGRFWRGLSPL